VYKFLNPKHCNRPYTVHTVSYWRVLKSENSAHSTLIFDIFRIGVVTGYREAMLNLLNTEWSKK